MKHFHSIFIIIFTLLLFGCHNQTDNTYEEAVLDVEVQSDWQAVDAGLQAAVGSIDVRYEKHEIPALNEAYELNAEAWLGERVSAQLVLWSREEVQKISCKIADFKSDNGYSIAAENAQARFVRYVISDEYGKGCGHREKGDYPIALSADVLDNLQYFNMEANTVRPVWLTVNIPADAEPGHYSSQIDILVGKKKLHSFDFQIEVIPQVLPAVSDWKFHLDLWQNPYAVARVANVEPWSQAHWKVMKPVMQLLADAGQKVITTTLNKRPWNGQTEDAFDSMIAWTKHKDGSWTYDYTVFDNWVAFMMDLGIKNQINCYSMVPWGNILFYFDEASGEEIKVVATPGSQESTDMWVPFLQDFVKHLDEKGWRSITRIAMDERNPDDMKAILQLLNETAPDIGVALADNHKSYKEYPDQLTDLCVAHGATVDVEDKAYRREHDYITTWYVCCSDRFPNVFTFSAPAEGAFIGWYTMGADFDGFLRWAYNSWVLEPLLDSRFRKWPSGDTYIIYPDARSSIRFERLREGIQDAEKIRILRERLQDDTEKLQQLNAMLAGFDIVVDPGNIEEMLANGKKMLNDLARTLN